MEPRVQVVTAAVRAWTARRDPEIVGQIVAAAHTTRRELEPVGEYAATVVGRIVREQSVQPVLLFAPAALPAEHLLVLEPGATTITTTNARHVEITRRIEFM